MLLTRDRDTVTQPLTGRYFSNKRVLVAGGAGLIGSYLVRNLLSAGAAVTVADNLSRGDKRSLSEVLADISFLTLDLRDDEAAAAACSRQHVVFNLAAPVAGILHSRHHHSEMLSSTIRINTALLNAAVSAGVDRYVFCSSSCVYPDDAIVPTPESEARRGRPEQDNEGYGWGKRIGELHAEYAAREGAIEVAIGRPFNSYGPNEYPEDLERAHVIPALAMKLLRGDDPIVVWGSGRQTRSFVHSRDTARALMLVAEGYAVADPVNLGHDHETSMADLARLLLDVMGLNRSVVFDTTKPEGPYRKAADVSKLRKITGFTPATTLREGLAEMAAFVERNYFAEKKL